MKAKKFILALFLFMIFVIVCSIFYYEFWVSKPEPNIVFISIDTLRADHLSCYGYKRTTSANIDELAQQGVIFLNAFSQSPKTTPSHMTMMTSLYPDVHGVGNWESKKSAKRLNDSIPTLASVLKKIQLHDSCLYWWCTSSCISRF